MPLIAGSARAVVAATAAHWFERPAFYAEAHRILVPRGILAIVEYVRDREDSPIAAALIEFMGRHGSERAYAPPDYRRELAEAAGFGSPKVVVLPHKLRLDLDAVQGRDGTKRILDFDLAKVSVRLSFERVYDDQTDKDRGPLYR